MALIVTRKLSGGTSDAQLDDWLSTKNEIELSGIPLPVTYTYNPDGSLATSTSGGITTTYTYSGSGLLEYTEDGYYRIDYTYNLSNELISKTVTTLPPVPSSTPAETPTPTPTVTPTVTPTISVTPSIMSSVTPTVTSTVTPTVTPTATVTVTPTSTPVPTPTVTPSETPSAGLNTNVVLGDGAASSANNSVVVGAEGNVDHDLSIVLGRHGQSHRTAEISNNINGDASNNFFRGEVGYTGSTTSTDFTEIFAGGVNGERYSLRTSSIVTFDIHVAGIDTVTYEACSYRLAGAIKIDNLDNVSLVNDVTKSILAEEQTSFDAEAIPDDVNNALAIRVKSASTNLTKWVVNLNYVEAVF